MSDKRKRIWLDCDTGHDDAYALLLAAHHPDANLIGVSTVHGNAAIDHTTHNTCAVLEALGRADVPVVRGEARPLHREAVHAPENVLKLSEQFCKDLQGHGHLASGETVVSDGPKRYLRYHGKSGLDGVTLLSELQKYDLGQLPHGVEVMYRHLMSQPDLSVWFVAVGPLTNLAKLLTDHPDVERKIQGVSIMGGAIGAGFTDAPMHRLDGPGNWSQYAEFNIYCDPEAADIVLQHHLMAGKTILTTLDLTHRCRATADVFEQLFPSGTSAKVRRMMLEVMVYFRDSYRKHSSTDDGPPLHDAVAVFAVLDPDRNIVEGSSERYTIKVVTEGEQDGRTCLQPVEKGGLGVVVPRGIRLKKFWDEIETCLGLVEKASPLACRPRSR